MSKDYEIVIVYRIYPKVSKVPPIFSDDKYNLSELCLKSFANSLAGIKAKIYVILDDCPTSYEELFITNLSNFDYELIRTNARSNQKTFGMQLDMLINQDNSELVYFAEDDYFYLPKAFKEMLSFIAEDGVDFISPFDHLDYYTLDLHNFKTEERVRGEIKWKIRGSTTMTFMTTKEKLIETRAVFETYVKKNDDASLWFSLSKKRMLNPIKFIYYIFKYFPGVKFMIKSWIHTPMQLLFGKKYKLWVPSRSLALHLDNQTMAPGINWDEEFKKYL